MSTTDAPNTTGDDILDPWWVDAIESVKGEIQAELSDPDNPLGQIDEAEVRKAVVKKLNKVVDIPYIGEAIEKVLFTILVRIAVAFAKKGSQKLFDEVFAKLT